MQRRYTYVIGGLIALLYSAGVPDVCANVYYSVSPLIIDATVQQRDIITKKITLKNTGDQPVTIFPTVNNISMNEGGGIEAFLSPVESDRTASLTSWIEMNRQGIDLRPNEEKIIDITLRIDPQAKPGTYHALIGFGYGRNRDEAEDQVESGRAPGTVLTISIDEKKIEFLKLSKFIISRFVTGPENQAIEYTFNNPSDEAIVPTGEIILYDTLGKEVGSISVNTESLSVPPHGEHVFTASVPTQGLMGKHKAFLSIEYGSTQKASIQDTNFFYVFPVKIIMYVVVCIALCVAMGAWYVHKKYIDEVEDDSDRLTFHIRENQSISKEHDLHLKKK